MDGAGGEVEELARADDGVILEPIAVVDDEGALEEVERGLVVLVEVGTLGLVGFDGDEGEGERLRAGGLGANSDSGLDRHRSLPRVRCFGAGDCQRSHSVNYVAVNGALVPDGAP